MSIDLWKLYKSLVQELMPNAEVTADRFQVMQQVTTELDAARKADKKAALQMKDKAEKTRILASLTDSKYSLLKNEEYWNERQQEKLKTGQAVSPVLLKMHALKEEFRNVFERAESWSDGVLR